MTRGSVLVAVLAACAMEPADADADRDGWTRAAGDCDDLDPDVHPEALEVCNGRDDDCDGAVDEGLEERWWEDADCDGYGRPGPGVLLSCSELDRPGCWVEEDDALDCDDDDPSVALTCDDTAAGSG